MSSRSKSISLSLPWLPSIVKPEAIAKRGHYKGRKVAPGKASPMELLPEFGEKRFKSMDDAGITVQVLSELRPRPRSGARRRTASRMAREVNDYLARHRHQASQALRRLRLAADGKPRRLRR